MSMTPIS